MKYKVLLMCCLSMNSSLLYGLIAGSNILLSIQSHIEFPSIGINNEMRGFGWFKNGFSLEDDSTTCLFNSIFPVSGTVNMREGTLTLEQDLHFVNELDLTGFGSIIGQNHALYFPSNLVTLPADSSTIEDTTIILSNDLVLTSTLSFKGTTTIKGRGHTIFLATDGGIQLLNDAHLLFEDVDVKNVGSGNIALANDNASITFDDTNLYFDGDWQFDTGRFLIKDTVHFYGSQSFVYDSAQTSTLEQFATWQIHDAMKFCIGKKTSSTDRNPLWFEDRSAVLRLSNCHLHITQYGFELVRGTIAYDAQVTLDTAATTTDKGLIIGNGDIDQDPLIQFDSGASVRLESSQFTFNSGSPHIIKTGAHKNARLSRNIGSNIVVLQDLAVPSMKIEMLSVMIPPMAIASGKSIEYNDTLIVLPGAEFDITSGRRAQLSFLLNGNDSIFFTKGSLPLSLDIEEAGNKILGNGNVTGDIVFKDSNAELISELDGEFDNTIIMQGGTLKLDDDLRFGVNAHLTGSGVVNLQEYCLHLPPIDFVLTSSITWQGQNASVNLNGHASLSTTCTCSGMLTINGNGNALTFLEAGTLEVAANSTLILKDIKVEGINGSNIRLLDASSRLILNDMLWQQSGDYTFNTGSLLVHHDVDFVGESRFIYDSEQTSTISSYSKMHFTDNSSLCIGKKDATQPEPLYFQDSSSKLSLDNASLHVINNGITLARGLVMFDHEVNIDVDSTSTTNGLTMGTNSADEDITFLLDANTSLNFKTGHLTYNNFGPNGFVASGNNSARLVRHEMFNLYIQTNLVLSNLHNVLVSYLVPPVLVAPGKVMSVNNVGVVLGDAVFHVDNLSQIGVYQHLTGNGSVLIERASAFPIPLFVSGTNNVVRGAGAISAPVILADENAQVAFDMQGEFRSFIQLNGGIVAINSNLDLGPDAQINGSGTIDIGSQKISLGVTDMDWTSTTRFVSNGGILEFNARVSFDTTTTISGTLLIDGNGNSLEFKDGARVVIEEGATLMYRNLRLENIEEKHVTCLGPTSRIVIDDSTVILGNDLTLDQGSVSFVNEVNVVGAHTFMYDSKQTSTIRKNSVLHISDNVVLKVGKTNPSVDEPMYFEDRTSVLLLDNCDFLITSSGMQFSTGTIRVEREVSIDADSTSTMNGLVLGNGQADDTLTFELSPGATVRFVRGHTTYNVQRPDAIVSLSPTARFVRANDSALHANYPVALSQMTLDHSKDSITTLDPSAYLSYENTTFIVPGTEFNVTGAQTDPLAITLSGSGALFLNKGAYPLATVVAGEQNLMHGNGNVVGPIILSGPTAELLWALNGGLASTLSLNYGTVTLLQDMYLARGITAITEGNINLDSHRLVLGSKELQWAVDVAFEGASGEVTFNNDVHLSGTWTFTGDCVVNGNGNALFLGEAGQINVANNATLRLKNMLIRDIAGENIRCLDDDGCIILDNIDWLQDECFTFSHGAIQWNNYVTMCGTNTFAYQTTRTSTILRQATLLLDHGCTFTYDPIGSTANDLLEFTDKTSLLQLSDAHLVSSLVGMKLTTGNLSIIGDSTLAADVVEDHDNIIQRGIIELGDQASDRDLRLLIASGSTLRIARGGITYKNLKAASLVMNNELSTIAFMPKTILNLAETVDVGIGRIELSKQVGIIASSGKELIGSLFELEA